MSDNYQIIDTHVHIAGPGDQYKGDLNWSDQFEDGIGFKALKFLKGWSFKKVNDSMMIQVLRKQASKLKHVDKLVVLAFDDVYEINGHYRGYKSYAPQSTLYVSNKFVKNLCNDNPELLPGISVHPFRDDALQELELYKNTAVLCKWMASAQLIDFDDTKTLAQKKLNDFYKKLVEINLPLLFHTGTETSIPSPNSKFDKYNNPEYMIPALEQGVTVILAHCGCSYFDYIKKEKNYVRETIEMFEKIKNGEKNWKLYADISALFSPFRKSEILNDIIKNIPIDRLIYGSDFPNPAKGTKECFLKPFLNYRKANLFNRYYNITKKWLKRNLPAPDSDIVFTNFHRLLTELGKGGLLKNS